MLAYIENNVGIPMIQTLQNTLLNRQCVFINEMIIKVKLTLTICYYKYIYCLIALLIGKQIKKKKKKIKIIYSRAIQIKMIFDFIDYSNKSVISQI